MSFSLLPDVVADSITQLRPETLAARGVHLLMLDFDNTIVPYTTDIPQDQVLQWFADVQKAGVRLCIVSNSKKPRVRKFCREHGLDCITHARKPFPEGIRRCMEKYGELPSACALAGDQIYTDVLGANCAGVCSILVRAIHNHTIWLKLRHVAEIPFRLAGEKRRIHYEES